MVCFGSIFKGAIGHLQSSLLHSYCCAQLSVSHAVAGLTEQVVGLLFWTLKTLLRFLRAGLRDLI